MSQHTFVFVSGTGLQMIAHVNGADQALASMNAGASAPTEMYPNMLWADTTNMLLKIRNNANTAWMVLGFLSKDYLMTQMKSGYSALKIVTNLATPNTKVDINYDSILLQNASGYIAAYQAGAHVINSAVVGANGIDAGSLVANTWYYLFVIGKTDGSLAAGLMSLSSTAPAMPTGYTYKRLVGACRTDATPYIIRFIQVGQGVTYKNQQQVSTGSAAQAWVNQDASAIIPPISNVGRFTLDLNATTNAATAALRESSGAATGHLIAAVAANGRQLGGEVLQETTAAQVVQLNISVAVTAWTLYCNGYLVEI